MRKTQLLRPLLAGLALMTLVGCKPLDDTMVAIFGRSMRDQRSFDPYENPVNPPENSVPFAAGSFASARAEVNLGQPEGIDVPPFTQADLGLPGVGTEVVQRLVNPIARDDAEGLARGEELYMRFCVVCHGPDGVGANAYIAAKHPILPAYNISAARVAGYSDEYLYAIIRVGRGLMPQYGSRISHFDRWTVVNYLRQIQMDAGNTPAGGGE